MPCQYTPVPVFVQGDVHWTDRAAPFAPKANIMPKILMAIVLSLSLLAQTPVGTPGTSANCPVTVSGGTRPPAAQDPFAPEAAIYHENGLWVEIPPGGILRLSPDDAITYAPLTGWRSTSVQWLRDEGVEGFVVVSGKRLDEHSDQSPQTPLSPQRQYVAIGPVKTGLAFPSEGCWEVTGTIGDHEITWVVEVRFSSAP